MEKIVEVVQIIMSITMILGIILTIVGVFAGAIAYFRETSDEVKFPKNETADRVYQEYVVKHYKNQNKKDKKD